MYKCRYKKEFKETLCIFWNDVQSGFHAFPGTCSMPIFNLDGINNEQTCTHANYMVLKLSYFLFFYYYIDILLLDCLSTFENILVALSLQ